MVPPSAAMLVNYNQDSYDQDKFESIKSLQGFDPQFTANGINIAN